MGEIREAADRIDDTMRKERDAAVTSAATTKLRDLAARMEAQGLKDLGPLNERMANAFTYHAPTGSQPERYIRLRDAGRILAFLILELCPDSPEKSTALAKIREAVMWANASIACNE